MPLIGANISSLETDNPTYKKKRKALSAAFFKTKMSTIAQLVKQVALETFAELQAQGDENVVDINSFTSKVQAHIIVSQLVGAEYCFKKITHIGLEDGKEEQITVGVFMDRILNDIIYRMLNNPLISMHESFAEKEIFSFDTHYVANARTIRNYIRSIIEDKKKLNDPEACDIVSLLLADDSY